MSIEIQERRQYDTFLRALEKGILLTINNQADVNRNTETLIVDFSCVDDTYVELVSVKNKNKNYAIIRKEDTLLFGEVKQAKRNREDVKLMTEHQVETIEIVGVN